MDTIRMHQEIFKIVRPYLNNRDHLTLSIGIVNKNETATFLYNGSNSQSIEEQKPLIYEIGSISKVFTTTLLGEMIQNGALSADNSIGQYFPTLSHDHPITLKHLANHTSGIPAICIWKSIVNRLRSDTPRDPYCLFSLSEAVQFYNKHPKEPKFKFRYSNAGMGLLGNILANQLHTDYGTAVKETITNPLEMVDTSIKVPSSKQNRLLQGFDVKGREQPPLLMNEFMGAGAIRSTVDDLLKFINAHMDRRNEGYQLTQQPTVKIDRNTQVGLGWMLENDMVWHNGATQGFSSFLGFDMERQLGVVVLSNYRSRLFANNPDQIGTDLLKLLRTGEY
ncbi:serine hydrolase domain-containing protein [Gorillibacterium massiliense]|uniref:serine hydrolase domain-containing protein n=1 Tax=Gorillibacterium massiliense TaxID=1280390 RepID=UPI0004B8BCF7|nr:serine hydrolase domain-containing protein [Gorillibacterium massiliense]